MARALDSGADDGGAADFTDGGIDEAAETVDPASEEFSGFVFKLQANLDPKHRDRLAYIRVCSGAFEKGMKVKHSRLAGREMVLSAAQSIMGNERSTIEERAYPGDVIGINNPSGNLAIGDTLYTGSRRISYSKIPSLFQTSSLLTLKPPQSWLSSTVRAMTSSPNRPISVLSRKSAHASSYPRPKSESPAPLPFTKFSTA